MSEKNQPEDSLERPVSIRKMYLHKRAQVLHKNFEENAEDIQNFVKAVHAEDFNATKDELLFARSLHWMSANLHTEASIKTLAQEFDVSIRKVQRLFSFFAKKSYTTVLLDMRLFEAKKLLAEMKNTVGEVAYLVGIKDHAYFTYLFRKKTGKTPSEFRARLMHAELT